MNNVTITRGDLDKLLFLAENSLYLQSTEFSNDPTDEDHDLMLAMWAKLGKDVPAFFARSFGWKHSELEPDGREAD